ncbi:MAG: hypothetical protein K0R67_995 [Paenibacillus sp.]|nr:hypothetical protein [Paenibacillus sp.]
MLMMVSKYPEVYFKPTGGTGGARIIRIKRPSKGTYVTQYNSHKTAYSSTEGLYRKLKQFANGRSYLLQKGIRLATTKGSPFDVRVMVQKTNRKKWVSSALFTKIGKKGKIVNNYNQGGRVGAFHSTLAGAGYGKSRINQTQTRLKRLGVDVGRCFDRKKSGFRELGLDVAIDRQGQLWILEVNTRPQFYPLKDKKDKTLYYRILSYAKQYGRYK